MSDILCCVCHIKLGEFEGTEPSHGYCKLHAYEQMEKHGLLNQLEIEELNLMRRKLKNLGVLLSQAYVRRHAELRNFTRAIASGIGVSEADRRSWAAAMAARKIEGLYEEAHK